METKKDDSPRTLAQRALLSIAECKIAPTPRIYEVFYRHFEGAIKELSEVLSPRIGDAESLKRDFVESLHRQYCQTSSFGRDEEIASLLGDELANFKSLVQVQGEAGSAYASKLDDASETFARADHDEIVEVAATLKDDTRAMQLRCVDLQERVAAAEAKAESLQRALREAHAAVLTDHLTQLGNRRYYDSVLKRSIRSCAADGDKSLFLALIDCDKFKQINDTHGHPFGDEVIKLIGNEIAGVQTEANVARLGGDEFAAVCRFEQVEDVEAFADQIRSAIGSRKIVNRSNQQTLARLTISIGIAKVRLTDTEATWHERADGLLYEAKRLGGDRAVVEKFGRQ